MAYPDSVISTSTKGKKEARILLDRGEYVRYTYVDPETSNLIKDGKETIILKSRVGKLEKIFILPLQGNRSFAFRKKDTNLSSKVWDKREKKEKSLF